MNAQQTNQNTAVSAVPSMPLRYWRTDCFAGLFTADLEQIRAILPDSKLHPVRVSGKRGVIMITGFNYHACSIGRYGEIGIGPLVTERAAPALLPLLLPKLYSPGVFVTHLPVTTLSACQLGREQWSYPKFVADMDFTQLSNSQSVHMEANGEHIMSMTVRKGGMALRDTADAVTYASHQGQLSRIPIGVDGVTQWSLGSKSAQLEIGQNHPVAEQLRALKISNTGFAARNSLDLRTVLNLGTPIGEAAPYLGYQDNATADARLSVRYLSDQEPQILHPAG